MDVLDESRLRGGTEVSVCGGLQGVEGLDGGFEVFCGELVMC